MTRRVFDRIAVLIVTVLAAGAGVASADPLVVTSGFFNMSFGDPTFFRFTGEDFDLGGAYQGSYINLGPYQTCLHCEPGSTIDLSSRASGRIGGVFSGQFQGAEYSNVALFGELRFDAPTVTAPETIARPFERHPDRAISFQQSAYGVCYARAISLGACRAAAVQRGVDRCRKRHVYHRVSLDFSV
jgi:hypothetical protein